MKLIVVLFLCVIVVTTAYPQTRNNNKLKFKPKSSRQDLAPATPTPVPEKTVVSQNTSQVLTIASNSTPSVIASTESPKASPADGNNVAPPASVTTTTGAVTTVAPPKSTTVVPKNATTVKPDEDDDEEDDSSEEEEDADVDSDVEEGDFEGGPPGPPPPGPEGDLDFGSDEDDDDDDRAADQAAPLPLIPANVQRKPVKQNKKVFNQQEAKVRETSGGIDAYVPGYVTDQGEVLVPIDTLERGLQYTIISDRYISIPQKKNHLQRNPVYLFRQVEQPASAPVKTSVEAEESSEEEPPQVFPVKETETSVIFATKPVLVNNTQKEEDAISGSTSQSSESQEDEDDVVSKAPVKTSENEPLPLGVVPATRPTGEDDEDEVVGVRRANNIYRRNFYQPSRHFAYRPQFDYMNNLYDNRRLDYPVVSDPYSANFYRSYGRPQPRPQPLRYNGPYEDVSYEDSLEDFGRSDVYDY